MRTIHLPRFLLGPRQGLSCSQPRLPLGSRPNLSLPPFQASRIRCSDLAAARSQRLRLGVSLFPHSGVNTDRRHLWSGLSNKAGAAYGEAFGSSADPASAATDRIIHAIDGMRRSQEAQKTGTKGTLSSIQEGEKLDVFLARGCGELTVELCQGVYGRELFHSIKRAGHHAKHSLILMKWPVYITNRLALSIAGLWWGGKESHTLLASDCATVRTDQLETLLS